MKTKQSKGKTPGEMLESKLEKLLFVDNLSTDLPQDTQEVPPETGRDWAKGFEKELRRQILMGCRSELFVEAVMGMITLLLRSEQKRWQADLQKRVEDMKEDDRPEITVWLKSKDHTKGYNQALSDVLALIDAGKGRV